jgi:hypothetical protein
VRARLLVAGPIAVVASLVLAASASAVVNAGETAQVTTNTDNGGPGCEVRDAIAAVTTNVTVGNCTLVDTNGLDDHVTFSPAMSGQTITLGGSGQLIINDAVDFDITGPGMNQLTVSGNDTSRVFLVQTRTAITGMSLVHGLALVSAGAAQGGAIQSTANVSFGLVLTDVKVANSAAEVTSGTGTTFADGGGIHATGPLFLNQSVVTGNHATATQNGGSTNSAEARGGAIFNQDDIEITDSTISGNQATATTNGTGQAAATAGIRTDGRLGLSGSTMSGNDANATASTGTGVARGAIYQNLLGSGQAGIEQSTIAGNTTSITASTTGADVGGLDLQNETVIRGSTIALNGPASLSADVDGANINSPVGTSEVEDTIIADPRGIGQNCAGTLTSTGFNDDSTGTGGSCFSTPQSTDLTSNPLLATGGLAPNGGLTQTIALQPTSPVIDQGSNAGLTDPNQDQRGASFLRPVDFSGLPNAGNGTDIGAFEVQQACAGFTQPTPTTACPSPPPPPPGTTTTPPAKKKKCKKAKKGASSAKKKKCKKKK